MLLQTNSYVVPKDRRAEHARLLRRFRQALARLGCTDFEVYEQVGANWTSDQTGGRFVQIMRFRDRRHQLAVQAAEREDPTAQALVAEFCELINFPYQEENNLFAVGYYTALLGPAHARAGLSEDHAQQQPTIADLPVEHLAPGHPAVGDPPVAKLAADDVPAPAAAADEIPRANGHPVFVEPDESGFDTMSEELAPESDEPAALPDSANGNGTYSFEIPRYAQGWHEDQNHNGTPHEPIPIDPDLAQVLDASLGDDQLDVALPAELIDPGELEGPEAAPDHLQPTRFEEESRP